MKNLPKFHNYREYADSMKPLNDQRFANSRFKTGPLHSKEFNISHSSFIRCMELSHDETFFITGGDYKKKENVLKLSIGDVFGSTQTELKPTVIHSDKYNTEERTHLILCLAISPDDRRIFSSGCSTRVLVHDIQRYVGFVGHKIIIYIIWALLKILFFFCRGQVLHSIAKDCNHFSRISVQPSSHKGDVFAAGSYDDNDLRIFDIRSSTTGIYTIRST